MLSDCRGSANSMASIRTSRLVRCFLLWLHFYCGAATTGRWGLGCLLLRVAWHAMTRIQLRWRFCVCTCCLYCILPVMQACALQVSPISSAAAPSVRCSLHPYYLFKLFVLLPSCKSRTMMCLCCACCLICAASKRCGTPCCPGSSYRGESHLIHA